MKPTQIHILPKTFTSKLITWFEQHHRTLPWRKTKNPYYIYLSEIILQQTQVSQGLSYYNKFVKNYPKVEDLANSSEETILKDWQGLGYYSRARNMHFACRQIVDDYDGIFPSNYEGIKSLKGVGDYTAAAIASFAFNQAKPVVDGNVFRFLSRLFGVETPIDTTTGKKTFATLAETLLDKDNPGTYNQAIMEFGALQCRPKGPNCDACPFQVKCIAFNTKSINNLPVKSKRVKQRDRFFYYLIIEYHDQILIRKREKKDIWQNLFDFKLIESKKKEKSIASFIKNNLGNNEIGTYEISSISKEYRHLLSHQIIHAVFIHLSLATKLSIKTPYYWIEKADLREYAVPKLIENYLKEETNLLSLDT